MNTSYTESVIMEVVEMQDDSFLSTDIPYSLEVSYSEYGV